MQIRHCLRWIQSPREIDEPSIEACRLWTYGPVRTDRFERVSRRRPHLEAATEVRLAVIGDYAYIPTYWRAKAGGPDEDGVPTSYYTALQFVCRPTVVDHAEGKVEVLTAQLGDFQPEGGYATVAVDEGPYARMLPGIRGLRLAVHRVDAKFKYDDHNPVDHRRRVIGNLEERNHALDAGAAVQERRRLAAIGDWKSFRNRS